MTYYLMIKFKFGHHSRWNIVCNGMRKKYSIWPKCYTYNGSGRQLAKFKTKEKALEEGYSFFGKHSYYFRVEEVYYL